MQLTDMQVETKVSSFQTKPLHWPGAWTQMRGELNILKYVEA